MTISAVVPAYNSKYIEMCLQSILNQSNAKLSEVIVVDDASTDDTVDRILKVRSADPSGRVSLLRLERNSGPSAAKNMGISKALGSHIATIDSDEVLKEDCLNVLSEDLLESHASAAMGFCLVPREMQVLTRVIGYELEFRLTRVLRGRHWVEVGKVGTGASLFPKERLVEAGLFDESRRMGEDTALSYRMGELGRKLVLSGRAKSLHYWQSRGLRAYVRQQVGYGEGIIQAYLSARRMPHDPISSPLLRFNALLAAGSLITLLLSPFLNWLLWISLFAVLIQVVIDLPTAAWILRRKRDGAAGLLSPLLLLVRNYAWAASLISGTLKVLSGRLRHSKSSKQDRERTPSLRSQSP